MGKEHATLARKTDQVLVKGGIKVPSLHPPTNSQQRGVIIVRKATSSTQGRGLPKIV